MSQHLLKRLVGLSMGIALVACNERAATTAPVADDAMAQATSLESEASRASDAGDTESATAFRGAAAALRYGVRPTQIAVSVHGETLRYLAVVTGNIEVLADRDTAIRRTLVAWHHANERPVAVLQVATLADHGSFSSAAEPASDPRARAHGLWADLVRASRWIATAGEAGLGIASLGGDCTPAGRASVRCVLADYRVAVDGLFRLNGASPDDGLPAVRILAETQLVHGVILGAAPGTRSR
jgi:hypothetical protein